MKNECCLIRDLLPLYAEDIISKESSEIIEAHLNECDECKEELALLKKEENETDLILPDTQEDVKPFKKALKLVSRQFSVLSYALIVLLTFLGVSFSDGGELMVRNVVIMPIVGLLSYVIFRKKALYKTPLILLIVEIFIYIIDPEEWDPAMAAYTVGIYCVFILAGFLIAMLLHFAFGKTDTKKKLLKIASYLTALALFCGICFLANGFLGNPISAYLAKKNATAYIEEMYPQSGYEVTDVWYNFVNAKYSIQAKVPDSIDSTFYMHSDFDGKIKDDTYKSDVLERQNTAERIKNVYSDAVDEVLNNPNFAYETSYAYGTIEFAAEDSASMPSYAIIQNELELDALYDIDKLGAKAGHIVINVYDDTVTIERLAQIMLDVKSLMEQGGIEFYAMDCIFERPILTDDNESGVKYLAVYDFLCSDIYEDGMTERVRIASENAQN